VTRSGRLFQMQAAATGKAQSPTVDSRVRLTIIYCVPPLYTVISIKHTHISSFTGVLGPADLGLDVPFRVFCVFFLPRALSRQSLALALATQNKQEKIHHKNKINNNLLFIVYFVFLVCFLLFVLSCQC